MTERRFVMVVDLGFGDAGKGLVTDAMVRSSGAHTVVRFNGGAQAGHNVVLPDGRHHTFSQLGAGSFVPGVETFLSRFVAVHPTALLVEANALARAGVADVTDVLSRVHIDARARITTPFHQAANRLREMARGDSRHGSCGIGFGETIADAEAGHAILAGDLHDRDRLRRVLVAMQERKRAELADVLDVLLRTPLPHAQAEQVVGERRMLESHEVVDAWMERIAGMVASVHIAADGIAPTLERDGAVVFEGAQGVLLDEWLGFHPHTTWSTCTFDKALELVRETSVVADVFRLGVLRTFSIRHGAGPMPTHDDAFDDLPEPHNVLGPWQGKVRRGWPDFVLLRYALAACRGIDGLALTHLDALPRLRNYRAATRYEVDGASLSSIPRTPPPDLVHQERLTRMLERAAPSFELLASDEEACIARFEAEAGAPVALVSRGPTAADVSLRPALARRLS